MSTRLRRFRNAGLVAMALSALLGLAPGRGDVAAHAPHAGLDFSMRVDTDGDTVTDCGTRPGDPTTCTAPRNGPFAAREYLESLGGIPAFRLMQLHFGFGGGVTPASDPDAVWPGCADESFYSKADFLHLSCGVSVDAPSVTYTGLAGILHFSCSGDGTLDLRHDIFPFHTHLIETGIVRHAEGDGTVEALTVDCVEPQPYPADTDGDGCPDEREVGDEQASGGRRNFFSRWDYLNPTGDGLNRVDDVLAVVYQYFNDAYLPSPPNPPNTPNPDYTADTDRSALGPNPWNLGPPNGQQRLDDVIAALASYFHDCS